MLCEYCKKEFIPIRKSAKFCSSSCRANSWKEKPNNKNQTICSLSDSLMGVISENQNFTNDSIKKCNNENTRISEAKNNNDSTQSMLDLAAKLVLIKEELTKNEIEVFSAFIDRKALEKVCYCLWFEHDVSAIIRNINFRVQKGDEVFDKFMNSLKPFHIFSFSEDTMCDLLGKGQLADYNKLCEKITTKMSELKRYEESINVKILELKAEINKQIQLSKEQDDNSLIVNNTINDQQVTDKHVTFIGNVNNDNKPLITEHHSKMTEHVVSDKIITSQQLADMKHKSFNFTGEWRDFLGQPEIDFLCAVYGMAGQGKSTFVTMLALYLAENFGRVIYIAGEEGFRKTIKDKFGDT